MNITHLWIQVREGDKVDCAQCDAPITKRFVWSPITDQDYCNLSCLNAAIDKRREDEEWERRAEISSGGQV